MATELEFKASIETQAADLFRRVRDSANLSRDELKYIDDRIGDLIDLVKEYEGEGI